jgi:hypothetical protein
MFVCDILLHRTDAPGRRKGFCVVVLMAGDDFPQAAGRFYSEMVLQGKNAQNTWEYPGARITCFLKLRKTNSLAIARLRLTLRIIPIIVISGCPVYAERIHEAPGPRRRRRNANLSGQGATSTRANLPARRPYGFFAAA